MIKELIEWIQEERTRYLRKRARKIFRLELYDNGEYWITVNGWRVIHNADLAKDPFKVLLNARERYVQDAIGGEPNALDDLYFSLVPPTTEKPKKKHEHTNSRKDV